MPLPTLSTTARIVLDSTDEPKSFLFIADQANGANNILISSHDPNLTESFDTLLPGQVLSFEDWSGILYAKSSAGAPSYAIEFVNPQGEMKNKASVVKSS